MFFDRHNGWRKVKVTDNKKAIDFTECMNQQCLDRRISNKNILIEELGQWQKQRNKEKATINWMFDVSKARDKLKRSYAKVINQN